MAAPEREVKPGFTLNYIFLASLVGLLPILAAGVIGYFANDYFRYRKTIEVLSTVSDNLVSVAEYELTSGVSIRIGSSSGDNSENKISSLYRYTVRLENKSEFGIDDFDLFLLWPEGVNYIAHYSAVTDPPELSKVIRITDKIDSTPGRKHYSVGLLNSHQTLTLSLSGYTAGQPPIPSKPLSVIVEKKDWTQRIASELETPLFDIPRNKKIADVTLREFLRGLVLLSFVAVSIGFWVNFYFGFIRSGVTLILMRARITGRRVSRSTLLLAMILGVSIRPEDYYAGAVRNISSDASGSN